MFCQGFSHSSSNPAALSISIKGIAGGRRENSRENDWPGTKFAYP
jgi:hypothetical protein